MPNTIRHKRGTTTPAAASLVTGELAINTATGGVFTKTDAGTVVAVGGGNVSTSTDNVHTPGTKNTFSHSATTAGLNIGPVAGNPSSLANGDVWNNSTTNAVNIRVAGQTHQLNTVRAWVNFNGVGNGTFAGGTSTVTRAAASTTATVTTTSAHGLVVGNTINALTGVTAGLYTVTAVGSTTTFSFTTVESTALTAASITFAVATIKAAFNVSSITDNGVGDYTINFANALPDANYSISGSHSGGFGILVGLISPGWATGNSVPTLKTANAARIALTYYNNAVYDISDISVAVLR